MDAFVIKGGKRLKGTVRINGSKNAALPIMATALLTDEPLILHDIPNLVDIDNMTSLLEELGCSVTPQNEHTLHIHTTNHTQDLARYDIVRKMRASISVLGPLLANRGHASVAMPGGCAIGDRPVDIHLRGLETLGADISLQGGNINVTAKQLRGTTLFLGGPFGSTVLGTANVMSAATLAKGTTIIEQAACEPEIIDLANMLNNMGAQISGQGSPRITIQGVQKLHGTTHTVMPDRIEAATYMIAAAITNGEVKLQNCPTDTMIAVLDRLHAIGIEITPLSSDNNDPWRTTVNINSPRNLEPITVTTQPYPGIPTDIQAQLMALLSIADGNSIITEKIFPERFMHVAELSRMGANLFRQGPTVMVIGTKSLFGAPVMASDLRASASLVLAGLAAKGTTTINRVYHLDRGYEKMELRLQALGADIKRINV